MNNREESLKKMPVTCLIILANLVAGILCIMAKNDHFDTGGLNYEYIYNNREYVRLITYMFLHANVAHFFNNMVALLIFGSTVENKLGSLRMAIIYFGSGIGGGAMSVYVSHMINPDTMRFSAGASAAVFGVMCAAVFLRIKGENEARRQDVIKAIVLIVIYACISFGVNVDIWGHIGGGITGGILVFLLSINKWEGFDETVISKAAGIILAFGICIMGVGRAGIGTNAASMKDSRIDTVKNQIVFEDETVTYGQCLDRNCEDARWKVFTSDNGKQVVQFDGTMIYDGQLSEILIQFTYKETTGRWLINYAGINGTALDGTGLTRLFTYLSRNYS